MPDERDSFTKPPLSLSEQISLLERRGLHIADKERTERYLKFIGYYRLAVYGRPYQKANDPEHNFQPGTDFEHLLDLYIFDRQLRLLVLDAIERIEVAFRTILNDHMALKYGHQWYTDYAHFERPAKDFNHLQLIRLIQKETGYNNKGGPTFCKAYYDKYSDPPLPPSWMIAEVLPIGSWSRIYSVLTKPDDRKHISKVFRVRYESLGSWIHSISYVRNVCAHHSLLWNLVFTVKPKLTHEFVFVEMNNKFYAQAVIIHHFMKIITNHSSWARRLKELVEKCPLSYTDHMGFSENWFNMDFWSL